MPSIIGTNPPVARRSEFGAAIESTADTTAQAIAGQIAFAVDSSQRWSVLRYYQAAATIALGATLQKSLDTRDSNRLETASLDIGGGNACKGISAAAVSNTGYYSWAYVAGYCPDAAMPSTYASMQYMRLSATYAGRLSSANVNATVAHEATWLTHVIAISLGAHTVSTANSTNSCSLIGWFM